jgi:hypothetical protein
MKTLLAVTPALALALSGCALYFGDDSEPPTGDDEPTPPDPGPTPTPLTTYQLSVDHAIAGEMPIAGIDSDREGGVWIAYRLPIGGYYDNDEVHVVHLDAQGDKLSDWTYTDEYTFVQGIAFDGTSLWLNYNSNVTADYNHLRKLDPANGDTLGNFATEAGIIDVTTRASTVVLSSPWNTLVTLDNQSGGQLARVQNDTFMYSTQMGIAAWDQNTWIVSRASKELAVVDANGKQVARGLTDQLADFNYENIRLAWDGEMLLMAIHNQILWLSLDSTACGGLH